MAGRKAQNLCKSSSSSCRFRRQTMMRRIQTIPLTPRIIVIESSGEQDNEHDPQLVLLQLVICCYDRGIDRQGYVDTVNVKETIMQHFKRKPIFGGAFEVSYPRKWELSDDDADYYYWGIVNLICKTPNGLKNEEVEALI